MAAKSIKLRNSFDNDVHDVNVIRAFQISENEGLLLIGDDLDNHELWLIDTDSAELLGTLKEPDYKSLRRAKNLMLYVGVGVNFDFVAIKDRLSTNIVGRQISSSLLREMYTYTQAYKR